MPRTFLYLHGADVEAARRFYGELVGLDEIFFSPDDGVVGFVVGDLQLTVAAHPDPDPAATWSAQLGWEGGTGARPSWGVELAADPFVRAVRALVGAGAECRFEEPEWVGYWSFPVRDPGGHTVELSTPEPSAWSVA